MPFCSKCGTEVPENINFCSKCGNALQGKQQVPFPKQIGDFLGNALQKVQHPSEASPQTGQPENLSLWEYYLKCFKNCVNFKGRARRKEYWGFVLFNLIIGTVLEIIALFIWDGLSVLYILYGLAAMLPGLALGIRRLHDTNKSGWWMLSMFIPVIVALSQLNGANTNDGFVIFLAIISLVILIILFIWLGLLGGNILENKYGPDPRESK